MVLRLLFNGGMTSYRLSRAASVCLLFFFVATARPAGAQPPAAAAEAPATQSEPAAQPEEDASALQLSEPEFRLINLPTTLLLPSRGMSFDLTHRFGGNLVQTSFAENVKSLFGLDDGATVGLEFRYGIVKRVQAAVFRTNIDRTLQFHGRYDAIRQSDKVPVAASLLLSIEGTNNFVDDKTPAVGAVVSRRMGDRGALYATPVWVHNVAPRTGDTLNTFMMGLGTRVRIRPALYISAEVTPRLSGYQPGPPEYGFALEARAGGHMFQLNFTNTFSTTLGQIARGGSTDSLYLGFNLARKFF